MAEVTITVSAPVAVHVASVARSVAAGGGFAGAPLPMPAAAQKVDGGVLERHRLSERVSTPSGRASCCRDTWH